MKPGIYPDLDFDEYLNIPAWNPSLVVDGLVSMKKLNYSRTHPKQSTPAMDFGSAIHCAVLEPDQFPLRYCVWPGGRRFGHIYDAFCEANEGKTSLTEDQYQTCLDARDSARSHVLASAHLCGPGQNEVSIVWEDRHSGLLCKGRIDRLLPGNKDVSEPDIIIDLKTTNVEVADDYAIRRVASKFRYDVRLAAYQDGISTLTGAIPDCKLIFVEQKPPHDVRVYDANSVLVQGYDDWQRVLSEIAVCSKTGIWPGCSDTEDELKVWNSGSEWEVK